MRTRNIYNFTIALQCNAVIGKFDEGEIDEHKWLRLFLHYYYVYTQKTAQPNRNLAALLYHLKYGLKI